MARNRDPDLNPALSVKDAGIRNLAKVAALPQVPGSGPVAAPKGKAKRGGPAAAKPAASSGKGRGS